MKAAVRLSVCAAALGLIAAGPLPGTEGAACASDEAGPALKVLVEGLKDARGSLRLEIYPANDKDFLADDTILLGEGKLFRRVEVPASTANADGQAEMCIRVPEAGRYAAVVLHDRNGNITFNPFSDGAGFPNNPKLGLSKPKSAIAAINIGPGVTMTTIVLNYWNGFSFGPPHHHHRR